MMTPFALAGLLAGISSAGFGTFVFIKSPNRQLARIWLLFSLSVSFWGLGTVAIGEAGSREFSRWSWMIMYAVGAIWIPPFFHHFVLIFLNRTQRVSLWIHYGLGLLFLAILPTHYFFSDLRWSFDQYYCVIAGPAFFLFTVWWLGLIIWSHVLLFRAHHTASPIQQRQILYFFLATVVGYSGGSLMFLSIYGVDFYPWGNFTVCIYPLIMSIAILKHQLMDVKIVLKKTLLYSIVSALLAAIYVGVMTFFAYVLGSVWTASASYSPAVAAAVITLLLNPIRHRVQTFLDKWLELPDPDRERRLQELVVRLGSDMAHEVKTPLSNIAMPAELSLWDVRDALEGRQSHETAFQKIAGRLVYIREQVLIAGRRVEAVQSTVNPDLLYQRISLNEVLEHSLKAMNLLLVTHKITIQKEMPDKPVCFMGNASQIEIVFVNLIKNAVEAMVDAHLPDKQITLRVVNASGMLEIHFCDKGPGISPERLNQLFSASFVSTKKGGAGVGLRLSRQIVEAHNGTLEVHSTSSGTDMIVRVPEIRHAA